MQKQRKRCIFNNFVSYFQNYITKMEYEPLPKNESQSEQQCLNMASISNFLKPFKPATAILISAVCIYLSFR